MSDTLAPPLSSTADLRPARAVQVGQSAIHTLLWVGPLLAATVFAKLGLPPLSTQGIGVTLPMLLGLTGLGLLLGELQIEPRRLVLGALCLGTLVFLQLIKSDVFSINSIALLAAIYLPFVLQLREPVRDFGRVLNFFQTICAVIAALGIVQFTLQGHVPSAWVFPVDELLPEALHIQNFNSRAVMDYGSEVLRANGVFMMEPSFLSQLLAIGIVLELSTRHRWWLLVLFGVGIMVSYSGTGMMVLMISLPVLVIAQRRWSVLLLAVVVGCVGYLVVQLFGEQLYLDKYLARANEFQSTGSSGFARFVGGFYLFDQFLWHEPVRALFGTGAGSFKEYAPMSYVPVAEMPLFKMVMEFGIVGSFIFFFFLTACMCTAGLPAAVSLAIGITFLLNGIYVPFSHAIALSLLLWTRPADATVGRPVFVSCSRSSIHAEHST